jgi:hypothetical protein
MDFVLAVVVVPDLVPVEPVLVPLDAVPEVAVAAVLVVEPVEVAVVPVVEVAALPVVLPVDALVPVDVVVVPPVRSTDPDAVPEAETVVDVVDALSLELPPIEPQAFRKSAPVRNTVRSATTRASANLNRCDNIRPMQSSW